MASLVLMLNPLQPNQTEEFDHDGPIIDWLTEFAPEGFDNSIEVYVNGEKIELDDLDMEVGADDTVFIAVMPAGAAAVGWALLKILASIAISYAIGMLLRKDVVPPGFADQQEQNTVYNLTAQQNGARLGEQIPVIYGSPITTPDYCSQPYTSYTAISADAGTEVAVSSTFREYGGRLIALHADYIVERNGSGFEMPVSMGPTSPVGTSLKYNYANSEYYKWKNVVDGSTFTTDHRGGRIVSVEKETTLRNADWQSTEGEQYLFYFLCLGMEYVNVDRLLIGEHDVTNNDHVDYRVYYPVNRSNQDQYKKTVIQNQFNAQVPDGPRFNENVITSLNFGGQELDEIKETGFVSLGVGASSRISRIEVDLNFTRGFYKTNNQGQFVYIRLDIMIQYKNSAGAISNKKVVFVNDGLKNVSPMRRTIYIDVPADNYEVNIKRLTAAEDTDGRASDSLRIDGVKGHVVMNASEDAYNRTTMMVVRLKASEFTNSAATSRIRAAVTRFNLPKGPDNSGWLTTNNPADIVFDMMTNPVYGANRPDDEVDTKLYKKLVNYWGGRTSNYGFHAVFNQKSTFYEAIKSALAVVGAEPLLVNGQVSANWDGSKPIRTQMFGLSNIVKDSLSIGYSFDRAGEPDGIIIEYRDPTTFNKSYERYPRNALNPRPVVLFGCKSQSHAQEYAQYLFNLRKYARQTVTFETELEGLIPRPGDRIAVSHDLADWGQSGTIISYDTTTKIMLLDEKPIFGAGTHWITLRDKYGKASAPISCTASGSQSVLLSSNPTFPITTDIDFYYSFGTSTVRVKDLVVETIEPQGDTVKITALNFDNRSYTNGLGFMSNIMG